MLEDVQMTDWIAYGSGAASAVSMLKAAWHWHSASETYTAADIAGLSDGRDVMEDLIKDTLAQNAANAKGSLSGAISAFFGSISIVAFLLPV